MPKSLRWGKGVKLIMASKHQRAEGGADMVMAITTVHQKDSNTTQIKGLALLLIDNPHSIRRTLQLLHMCSGHILIFSGLLQST